MTKLETRTHILTVASALIAQKGFDKTSMSDIVNASGISKGGIYWHFKNKDEIILAIVENIFTQQMAFLDSVMAAESTAIEQLDHLISLISASLETITKEIPSPLDIYALAMRRPDIMSHMKNYFLRYQEHLVDLLEQGVSEGDLQVEHPQQTAFVLMSTVEGILLLAIVTETAETIPDSLRQAKEIFLHGIKGN